MHYKEEGNNSDITRKSDQKRSHIWLCAPCTFELNCAYSDRESATGALHWCPRECQESMLAFAWSREGRSGTVSMAVSDLGWSAKRQNQSRLLSPKTNNLLTNLRAKFKHSQKMEMRMAILEAKVNVLEAEHSWIEKWKIKLSFTITVAKL